MQKGTVKQRLRRFRAGAVRLSGSPRNAPFVAEFLLFLQGYVDDANVLEGLPKEIAYD